MTRRQADIVANEAFSTVDHNDPMNVIAGTLPPQPATAEDRDSSDGIAMELAETDATKKPKTGGSRNRNLAEWTCTAEFERNMGGTPRNRQKPPQVDNMEPPPYQPWNPADEDEDDYSDLIVPDVWPDKWYWSP